MTPHVYALSVALAFGSGGEVMDQGCPLTGALTPVKERFVVGEPIELELRFANVGTVPGGVGVPYPSMSDEGEPCLRLVMPGVASSNASPEPRALQERLMVQLVAPASSWSLRTHLQRFAPRLNAGNHEIHYELAFPCFSEGSRPLRGKVSGAGILRFAVDKARPDELSAALGRYAQRLSSTDAWERRTAVEALSLVDDPAVVPFLKEMNALGLTQEALAALERFEGDPTAEAIVMGALHSQRADATGRALVVLAGWRRVVPPDVLREVLAHGNDPVRVAALRYMQTVPRQAYLPLLAPYVSDENASVVLEARKTRELLLTQSR